MFPIRSNLGDGGLISALGGDVKAMCILFKGPGILSQTLGVFCFYYHYFILGILFIYSTKHNNKPSEKKAK